MFEIVNQPTNNSCVMACVSIITQIDVNDLYNKYHDRYHTDPHFDLNKILDDLDLPHTIMSAISPPMDFDNTTYLVIVPSLNIVAKNHLVVIDNTEDDYTVYDPNNGKPGKKYYVAYKPSNDLEVSLDGYTRIVSFKHSDIVDWRNNYKVTSHE